jgi:hypothetical protein
MSEWENRFKEHAAHESVRKARELVDGLDSNSFTEQHRDALARLRAVIAHSDGTLHSLDPLLASRALLNNVHKTLSALQNELRAFVQNRDAQALENAQTQADTLIDILSRVGAYKGVPAERSLGGVMQVLRDRSSAIVEDLRKAAGEVGQSHDQLLQANAGIRQDLDALRNSIDQHKNRLDTAIAEYQKQFSEAEDRRRSAAQGALEGFASEATALVQSHRDAFKQTREEVQTQLHEFLADLERRRTEAVNIVNVIGNIGVTGNYKAEAATEQKAANVYRRVALACMFMIVVGVGATIWIAFSGQATWQQIAVRLAVTLALAIPAGYAAREAEHHRRLERHYRKMELELASVDAYLVNLPVDDKNTLKLKLAERFFARAEAESPAIDQKLVTTSALDIVKTAIENLTKR